MVISKTKNWWSKPCQTWCNVLHDLLQVIVHHFYSCTNFSCLTKTVVVRLRDPPGRQQEAAGGLASACHGHARPWPWPAAASSSRSSSSACWPWPWRSTHSETSYEGEDGEQRVEEDVEASEWGSGEPFWLSQTRDGAPAHVQQWWGRALVHGGHAGISSNTWCAAKWRRWDAGLGQLWAELDLGPKTKFVHHAMLYNFD